MISDFALNLFTESLAFEPLEGQSEVLKLLAEFVTNSRKNNEIFLLKGYAGTGKTSIIAGLVKAFGKLKIKSVLLAPTGRAAKVISSYSRKEAYTIHKQIYRQKSSTDGMGKFVLDANLMSDTIFIVDEASMISDSGYENSVFGSGRLLEDLIEYVYSGNRCKLILSGDTAQLPPVGLDISPALDIKYLSGFGKDVIHYELTEVVRQTKESGILFNATELRHEINHKIQYNSSEKRYPKFELNNFTDLEKIGGADLIESLNDAYDKYSETGVSVICRSNKRANKYNQGIRTSVMFREDEISQGDLLMIVKNNYFWAEDIKNMNFIANGDIAVLEKIYSYTERYNFRFADVKLSFPDYNNTEIDVKILLDTLQSEKASLSQEQNKELFFAVSEDYQNIRNKKKRFEEIRKDPFFNALQVKFAYAITCHKAQGGQWDKVFLDQGWLTDEMIDTEYLRWLYTAFTRASKELSLVNFNKNFFEDIE